MAIKLRKKDEATTNNSANGSVSETDGNTEGKASGVKATINVQVEKKWLLYYQLQQKEF